MTQPTLTHLERRKIEAGVLVPMIQAFQRAIGTEKANEVAREVIVELARNIDRTSAVWSGGGSLTIENVAKTPERLEFNVTRCQYAEYFKSLGLPELGALFHCSRDFAMVEGFSPDLKLERTQTIMQGASHCDFRFSRKGRTP